MAANAFCFEWETFSGCIKGINGNIELSKEGNGPIIYSCMAKSCLIEVVEKDTYRTWKKVTSEDDLSGDIINKVPHIVLALKRALDASQKPDVTLSIDVREASSHLAVCFSFSNCCSLGTRSVELLLDEEKQNETMILKRRVQLLSVREAELCAENKRLKEKEAKLSAELSGLKTQLGRQVDELKARLCCKVDDSKTELLIEQEEDKQGVEVNDPKKPQHFSNKHESKLHALLENKLEVLCNDIDDLKAQLSHKVDEESKLDILIENENKLHADVDQLKTEIAYKVDESKLNELSKKLEELYAEVNDLTSQPCCTFDETKFAILNEKEDIISEKVANLTCELADKVDASKLDVLTEKQQKLCADINSLKEREQAEDKIRLESKFLTCGDGLSISNCGRIVAHNGTDGWKSVVVGKKMSSGVHYAEYMSLRMNSGYHMLCGVLPTSTRDLNKQINAVNGGFCFNVCGGTAHKHADGYKTTDLPGSNGNWGPVVIGVLLSIHEKKIQFFLNGVGSKMFEIPLEEYHFAVSLHNQWDAVQLLKIECVKECSMNS